MDRGVEVLPKGRLRGRMGPLRGAVLEALQAAPGSASEVAERLGESRQRVGYHVRELDRAGLLTLAETRQRRGFEERVFRATARAVVSEPEVHGRLPGAAEDPGDAFAAETLIGLAARSASEVTRMRASAADAKKRLLTFALETEVNFRRPADVQAFADALGVALAELVERFGNAGGGGRRYRVIVAGHPRPKNEPGTASADGSPPRGKKGYG